MALLASNVSAGDPGTPAGADWRLTIAYIDQNGSEMERARLRGILGRARPDAKVVRALEVRQNDDGGFPHGMIQGRLSTIEATTTVLRWMDDLGLLGGPHAERAGMFLLAAQRPDGSWDEPPGLIRHTPPPRLMPGDPRVRSLSTALVAFWLVRLGEHGSDAVARAMAYLRERQAPDGRFVGYLSTTWLAAALFRFGEGPDSAAAAKALAALADVPAPRWSPAALAGMLNALGDTGARDDLPLVRESLARLTDLGRSDGSWVSEEGDAHHVEVTLGALRALVLYAAVSPRPRAAVEPAQPGTAPDTNAPGGREP